jgi:hypothetical protein
VVGLESRPVGKSGGLRHLVCFSWRNFWGVVGVGCG